ncbi:hypothetical protein CVT26_002356 [Gymnopilus dilepis]|uniref:Uncharacterized protein n=1 Tax=Gymnopilus dilepis TaxID=231916 RepID=A0A409Y3P7_9AGAR|nr:hypothetical protein CVT26_002356 [Gymnopilus dilepis]
MHEGRGYIESLRLQSNESDVVRYSIYYNKAATYSKPWTEANLAPQASDLHTLILILAVSLPRTPQKLICLRPSAGRGSVNVTILCAACPNLQLCIAPKAGAVVVPISISVPIVFPTPVRLIFVNVTFEQQSNRQWEGLQSANLHITHTQLLLPHNILPSYVFNPCRCSLLATICRAMEWSITSPSAHRPHNLVTLPEYATPAPLLRLSDTDLFIAVNINLSTYVSPPSDSATVTFVEQYGRQWSCLRPAQVLTIVLFVPPEDSVRITFTASVASMQQYDRQYSQTRSAQVSATHTPVPQSQPKSNSQHNGLTDGQLRCLSPSSSGHSLQSTLVSQFPPVLPAPSDPLPYSMSTDNGLPRNRTTPLPPSRSGRSSTRTAPPNLRSPSGSGQRSKLFLSPTAVKFTPKTKTPISKSRKYIVHPSRLIKSAHLNRFPFKTPESLGAAREPEQRLATLEYRGHQDIHMWELETARNSAQYMLTVKELEEHSLLLDAMRKGMDFASLDIDTGVSVAAAAKETLVAEEALLSSKLEVCKWQARILADELEELRARVRDADYQLSYLQRTAADDAQDSNHNISEGPVKIEDGD